MENRKSKDVNSSRMMDSTETIVPLAFCQKRLAGFTRRRGSKFAPNHDADYEESGSTEFACIAECFNCIHLGVDHTILTTAATQSAGHTVLPNG
jgi:hypothetical protein